MWAVLADSQSTFRSKWRPGDGRAVDQIVGFAHRDADIVTHGRRTTHGGRAYADAPAQLGALRGRRAHGQRISGDTVTNQCNAQRLSSSWDKDGHADGGIA